MQLAGLVLGYVAVGWTIGVPGDWKIIGGLISFASFVCLVETIKEAERRVRREPPNL
jgi:hypothetical protein